MADRVIFEGGDDLSEQYIGEALAQPNIVDYVLRGVSSSIDFGNNTVDYTQGELIIENSNNNQAYFLSADARSGLSLTDSATNHVFVEYDPTTDDAITFTINTTGTAPTDPNLKIEEIDTSADTSTEFNRSPDVTAGTVTTESLVIGGTLYELDGTIDETTSSTTYSVGGSYRDLVLVAGDATGVDEMQVNGDTGANYDFNDQSDTETTGANQWTIPRGSERAVLWLKAQGTARIRMGIVPVGSRTGKTVGGRNDNISGDIDQFTLKDSGGTNRDIKVRVYGRVV